MKPILMNTDMVRAALDGRKTVTRRMVRLPHCGYFEHEPPLGVVPPYRPGDILYVRETWCYEESKYHYRADGEEIEILGANGVKFWFGKADGLKWRPSIHMPKEAARLFLRVISVRIERLQDITDADAQKEGAVDREDLRRIWNNCYSKPRPVKDKHGEIDHYESYPWEDVMETRTFRGKPWYIIGNPWVWVIEFERISRERNKND